MAKWHYYDSNGQKQGPFSSGQLKWLAKNGKITPETTIENEDGKTAPAGKVQGLTFLAPVQPAKMPPISPFTVAPPAASVPPTVSSSIIDLFSNPQNGEMGKISGLTFLPISREKGAFGRIIWGLARG